MEVAVGQLSGPNTLQRAVNKLVTVMTGIAGCSLVAMLFISGGDIVGRAVFAHPIEGSSTIISGLLFPVCVFFALPYLASISGHIRINFSDQFFTRIARFRAILFSVLIASFWALVAWQAGERAWEAFALNQAPIGAVGIPAVYSYGSVALGSGLASVAHLVWWNGFSCSSAHGESNG